MARELHPTEPQVLALSAPGGPSGRLDPETSRDGKTSNLIQSRDIDLDEFAHSIRDLIWESRSPRRVAARLALDQSSERTSEDDWRDCRRLPMERGLSTRLSEETERVSARIDRFYRLASLSLFSARPMRSGRRRRESRPS